MGASLVLRPATADDAELLLDWRNDEATRHASHASARVEPAEHRAWLAAVLANPQRRLLIAEEDGTPVGTVRADFADGAWELSWTTAPAARGRGLAKRMVALAAAEITEVVRAEIKAGNIASARIAEHAGLKLHECRGEVLHYRRDALT